ncbi:ABC transporter substrate-binding protein [Rhodopseudomonas sp.]|uniref:ABC transporter substrate-binding protein n=1 Tax=Rhodopseudomonas sp. TaxID=1078 RepID=UPI003B3BE117
MRLTAAGLVFTVIATLPTLASAQKNYDEGASDGEIKLGQTMPYSGPVSAAGASGTASTAYFDALNKAGGINGRKVKLLTLDDAYSPPKTVEVTRKLVESDGVFLIYGSVGTPTNAAIQRYMNSKKVPQLFLATGASRFKDPKTSPWTLGLLPGYDTEARALARYVLKTVPEPKIAMLVQNDDLGKDFAAGFKAGLGDKAQSLIVSQQSFEVSDPTISSQVVTAKASGANVFFFAGTQKFGAMQIRTRHELGWKPLHVICSTSSGVEAVLKPAGFEAAEGVVSTAYVKDPTNPAVQNDEDVKQYLDWLKTNLPQRDAREGGLIVGYIASYLTAQVLKEAGDDLTRANVMKIATNLKNVRAPMLLPGIAFNTSPTNYAMIDQFQIQQFRNGAWTNVGDVISGE